MAMTTLGVSQAVEHWITTIVPALSSYDYPPEEIAVALPLVMAEVQSDKDTDVDASFPGFANYQQTFLRVWVVNAIILISPDPAWTASHTLYGYVDSLVAKLTKGQGVRIQEGVLLSQFYTANYNPPEALYGDGTKMRQVTLTVTVAEMIGA